MIDFKASDGVGLYVESIGGMPDGDSSLPLIIWSHGFTGSARNWRSTLRKFSGYRHIIYDMRGHARSDAPVDSADYSLERLGQDVVDLVQHFASHSAVVLVGLSLGAVVSFAATKLAPDLFSGLVLSSMPDTTHKKSISNIAAQFGQAVRENGLETAGEKYVWGSNSGLSVKDAQLIKQGFMEHPAHSLASILENILTDLPHSSELAQELIQAQVPTLLLYGENDEPARAFSNRVFAIVETKMIASCYEVQGGGHLLNLTSGQVFCDQIDKFFTTKLRPQQP